MGAVQHLCQPTSGAVVLARVKAECRHQAQHQPFTSARRIVDTVLRNAVPTDQPLCIPAPDLLARNVNRQRQIGRPSHPQDLSFDINMDALPDNFFIADIMVNNRRHLIFATNHQLHLLKRAKNWYVDATFKVIRKPFYQLFSIHAFITSDGENMKQVPLVFVVMSGKRTTDYRAIFTWIKDNVGELRLKSITCDFEKAVWLAVKKVFSEDIEIHGCLYHWEQSIFRKIQELGLVSTYCMKKRTYNFCKALMALPYLPADWIESIFQQIASKDVNDKLRLLLDYIEHQWINNATFIRTSWSVYQRPFRTNNDVEGWHHRFNLNSNNTGLNLYKLIELLHDEAQDVALNCELLSNGIVLRRQRKTHVNLHLRIHKAWNQFASGDITAKQLMTKCRHISQGRFPLNNPQ